MLKDFFYCSLLNYVKILRSTNTVTNTTDPVVPETNRFININNLNNDSKLLIQKKDLSSLVLLIQLLFVITGLENIIEQRT